MKFFLSKIVSIFHEINRLLFIMDLKLIYFFADVLFGYLFYIFCVFYGFCGCTGENRKITHSLAVIFVVFMIGLVMQTYALMKIPFTRKYLQSLVGKNFIEKHLGKHTGSEALLKILKYATPALGLMALETVTSNREHAKFLEAAKQTEKNFELDLKKTGSTPSREEYEKMFEKRDYYLCKAAHSQGVVTRVFASSSFSFHSDIR